MGEKTKVGVQDGVGVGMELELELNQSLEKDVLKVVDHLSRKLKYR